MEKLQKKIAQAIINLFETGRPLGDYANVTYHPEDPGGLTYGRSQTTLNSGGLHLLVQDYCNAPGELYAAELQPYLQRLLDRDARLNTNTKLRTALQQAGADPVMMAVQDAFFDRQYWQPAERHAANLGIITPLGITVVYDSIVHGSFQRIRDRVLARLGRVSAVGEHAWIAAYVSERHAWLANHSIPLLRRTVYRMQTFEGLIRDDKWDLPLPLLVRGAMLTRDLLEGGDAIRNSAHEDDDANQPTLRRGASGEAVEQLQRGLAVLGHALAVDGDFGPKTEECVKQIQLAHGLRVDGIVGPATWNLLDQKLSDHAEDAAVSNMRRFEHLALASRADSGSGLRGDSGGGRPDTGGTRPERAGSWRAARVDSGGDGRPDSGGGRPDSGFHRA
ncbi:MAG: chitosanase [Candidatus Hydrogenedens sp.]|nr:chitosanase [Candidatus Hydrogenedens sp.]